MTAIATSVRIVMVRNIIVRRRDWPFPFIPPPDPLSRDHLAGRPRACQTRGARTRRPLNLDGLAGSSFPMGTMRRKRLERLPRIHDDFGRCTNAQDGSKFPPWALL